MRGYGKMVPMSEPKWLSPIEREAWLALLSVTTLLPAALDSELQVQAKITLFDYDVLAMLSEDGGPDVAHERTGLAHQRLVVAAVARGEEARGPWLGGTQPLGIRRAGHHRKAHRQRAGK